MIQGTISKNVKFTESNKYIIIYNVKNESYFDHWSNNKNAIKRNVHLLIPELMYLKNNEVFFLWNFV